MTRMLLNILLAVIYTSALNELIAFNGIIGWFVGGVSFWYFLGGCFLLLVSA